MDVPEFSVERTASATGRYVTFAIILFIDVPTLVTEIDTFIIIRKEELLQYRYAYRIWNIYREPWGERRDQIHNTMLIIRATKTIQKRREATTKPGKAILSKSTVRPRSMQRWRPL